MNVRRKQERKLSKSSNAPRAIARKAARGGLDQERDFRGYGEHPPHPNWPGGARIAVNVNLNVEAGGERSILEGDDCSENVLTDIGFPAYPGKRSPMVESAFEYGPRVGCWRLLRTKSRSASSALSAGFNNIPSLRERSSRRVMKSSATAGVGSTTWLAERSTA